MKLKTQQRALSEKKALELIAKIKRQLKHHNLFDQELKNQLAALDMLYFSGFKPNSPDEVHNMKLDIHYSRELKKSFLVVWTAPRRYPCKDGFCWEYAAYYYALSAKADPKVVRRAIEEGEKSLFDVASA